MKNEIKVGILGVAALFIVIFGYKFLKGQNILDNSQTYYIRYDDVQQMAVSDGVFINGFKVGSVVDMQIDPEDANFILVEINVNGNVKLPKNTKAILAPNGVLGTKMINLSFDQVCESNCLEHKDFIEADEVGLLASMIGEPDEVKKYYDGIRETIQGDERIQGTLTNMEAMILHLNGVTAKLDELLATSNKSLNATFRNLDQITGEIASNKTSITTSLANLEEFSDQLAKANVDGLTQDISSAVGKADQTFEDLKGTLTELNGSLTSLKGITSDLQKGEGSLGRLLKDDEFALKLEQATTNLNLLLQDFRLNPKRYVNVSVFGKKQKEYEVPEDDPAFKEE